MVARKRRENESYEDYKEDLKEEEERLQRYLKGRVVWNRGTYVRPERRPWNENLRLGK